MIYLGDEIPFTKEAREKIALSVRNYRRHAAIEMTFEQMDKFMLGVHVTQLAAPTGKILTSQELTKRAVDVFEGLLPAGCDIFITTTVFEP